MTTPEPPSISFQDYINLVSDSFVSQLGEPRENRQRLGQMYFNILHQVRPELANLIRGSYLDPFHVRDTQKIGVFLEWAHDRWERKEDPCTPDL